MEGDKEETEVETASLAGPSTKTSKQASDKKKLYLIWKNVFLVSLSFSISFMAFASLQNLQSSLNPIGGLGVASLSVVYSFAILGSLFFTSLIIKKKGCKWSLVVFTFCYAAYAGVNLYPTWYTMIPASVFIGIAAGPLWTAKSTYITSSALQYAEITNVERGPAVTKFFGTFQVIMTSGSIVGSLLISIILKPGRLEQKAVNETGVVGYKCGAADCPSKTKWPTVENGTGAVEIASPQSVHILMGVFLGAIVIAGLIILLLVDDLKSPSSEKNKKKSAKSHILDVGKIIVRDKRMACLLPLGIYAGLFPGFISVDFSKSYVTCAYGIENLGYVLTVLLCAQTFGSGVVGKIEQYAGRRSVIFANYLLTMGLLAFMLKWQATSFPSYVFYLVATCFGLTKAIWRTESNAVTGVLFADKQEPAFAVLRVCVSVGFLMSFASGYYVCVYIKIYCHMFFVTLTLVGYEMAEYFDRQRLKKEIREERLNLQTVEAT